MWSCALSLPRRTTAVLYLLAAGAAFAAPFSHKLHLRLKPDCSSCHTVAASSTKPADNLLPSQAVCRDCHQPPPAIKDPAKTTVTRFNHALHLKFGNVARVIAAALDSTHYLAPPPAGLRAQLNTKNACAACHHGIEESEAVGKADFPYMADCLVCHTKVDAPFSCELCHDAGPHLKPASHVPAYLEAHSSPKATLDKPSCVVCHGHRFMCLGCH